MKQVCDKSETAWKQALSARVCRLLVGGVAKWPLLILLLAAALVGGAIEAARGSVAAPHLVINEVDYDNVGTDAQEFVELFNGTGSAIDLSSYAVAFVNGLDGAEYLRVPLAGSCLAAGQYLVVMDPAVQPAPGALSVLFPGATNQMQNGAPDGLALIDVATSTVVDALSYEGAITAAHL